MAAIRSDPLYWPLTKRLEAIAVDGALFPGVPVNHLLLRVGLPAELDAERLCRSFDEVAARNVNFRMTLAPTEQGFSPTFAAFQGVLPPLTIVDLQGEENPSEAEHGWLQEYCRDAYEPGELMWRAALLHRVDGEFVLCFEQSHLLFDGQSAVLMIEAIERAYLGQSPHSSKDYGEELHERARRGFGPEGGVADAFWQEHLAGAPPPSRLYGTNPAKRGALTNRHRCFVDEQISRTILEHTPDASPAQVFAAALTAWLVCCGDSEDVVFGVSFLNRGPGLEKTIGMLMEICPHRMRATPNTSFRELLRQSAEAAASMKPHRWRTPTAREAQCEIVLNLLPQPPVQFAGLASDYQLTTALNVLEGGEWESKVRGSTREAMTIYVVWSESDGRYRIDLDFNSGQFPSPLAERSLRHFVSFIEQGVTHPDQPVGALDVLTHDDRTLVFPNVPAIEDLRGAPLLTARVAAQADARPEAVAIRHRGQSTTYRTLHDRTRQLTGRLVRAGVEPGDRVAVSAERSPDLIAALLAVLRAGACYVPLDPHQPVERLRLILEDAEPRLILGDSGSNAMANAGDIPLLRLDEEIPDEDGVDSEDRAVRSAAAHLLFTSGSTGRPKGVQVNHGNFAAFLEAMRVEPGCGPEDRLLAHTTVGFDIAGLELFLPLVAGGTVILGDSADRLDPRAVDRLLTEESVTMFQATPATYHMLLQGDWQGAPVKALVGGEALSQELAQELLTRVDGLWNMYGPTETTVWSTCERIRPGAQPITIGKPIRGTRIYVLNRAGGLTPPGVAGELCIGGLGVADGYFRRADLTARHFVADPFASTDADPSGATARMYRTGDIVRLNGDGALEFLGRRDHQVKVRGFRIELGEIESVLESHPAVAQAIVAARGVAMDATLIAYVRSRGDALEESDLEAFLRRKLPPYMVPSRIVHVTEFPLTAAGKVDRKRLPDPPKASATTAPGGGTLTPFEKRIATMWHALLGEGDYGQASNFFESGGNSLRAIRLTHQMQSFFGVSVDVGSIFTAPTLREQAALVRDAGNSVASSVITLQPSGDATPIYGLFGVHLYAELARRLSPRRPFHAVYVAGEALIPEGADSQHYQLEMDTIVSAYWRRIEEHSAGRPFDLLGFCFGGIVAYEIARHAQRLGAPLRQVIMLDSPLWTGMKRNRVRQVVGRLKRMVTPAPPAPPQRVDVVREAGVQLLAALIPDRVRRYQPRGRYDGRCILVSANDPRLLDTWRVTPMLGWEPWFGEGSQCIRVNADHEQLLHLPAVEQVARGLSPVLTPPAKAGVGGS